MAHSLPGQHCLHGLEDGLRVLHHRPPAADGDRAREEGVSRLLRGAGALAEEEDMAKSSDDKDLDEEDNEKFYFFDCVYCKDIFRQKEDLISHMNLCSNK